MYQDKEDIGPKHPSPYFLTFMFTVVCDDVDHWVIFFYNEGEKLLTRNDRISKIQVYNLTKVDLCVVINKQIQLN